MVRSSLERVTVKEVGEEHTGKTVAYAHALWADGPEGGHGYAVIDVAAATVGEQGATLSFYPGSNGSPSTSSQSAQGFEHPYEVEVFVSSEDPTKTMDANGYRYDYGDRGGGISFPLSFGYGKTIPALAGDTAGTLEWGIGNDIPATIKRVLGAQGLSDMYGPLYYRLAVTADDENRIADMSMNEETLRQKQITESIRDLLREAHQADLRLEELIRESKIRDLAVVADSEFLQNRRRAHEIEEIMRRSVGDSAFTAMRLFAPVGHGRSARTWPFMDAGVSDERKAFGPELSSLREGNTGRVLAQLALEGDELRGRESFANDVVVKLTDLEVKEKVLNESTRE